MRKFLALLRVQAAGAFGINRIAHDAEAGSRRRLAVFAALSALIAAAFAAYAWMAADALARMGATDLLPAAALIAGSAVGAGITLFKASGALFPANGLDDILTLPLVRSTVVFSRLAPLYAINLLAAALLMVPFFIVYGARAGCTALDAAAMAASVFVAPLLPMAAAVLCAYGFALVSSRFARARVAFGVISLLAVVLAVIGAAAFSFSSSPDVGASLDLSFAIETARQGLSAMLACYPPAAWAAAGIAFGDAAAFFAFACCSILAAAVAVAVVSRKLATLGEILAGSRKKSRTAASAASARRPFAAFVVKELRLVANTPIYLTNSVVGAVLAVAFGAACLVVDPTSAMAGIAEESAIAPEGIRAIFLDAAPWVLAFCTGIGTTGGASVSLEGACRWIAQTAPAMSRTILGAKMAASLVIFIPAACIGAALCSVGLSADPLHAAALVLAPCASACFSAAFGVFMDARKPHYDWTSEYEPVKRSIAVVAGVFLNAALTVLAGLAACVAGLPASFCFAAAIGIGAALAARRALNIGMQE